ncbi:conserved unknown protein [Ectocarpus siliculosus]|uniref:UDENN domain-containing protein n=1 Tax=Ectocarpus siliculosus TaxID=2880 RepID=D7FMH7_ECTSI|nr:conserved unknown protein [Ectocarpus siliculosus]|eukprot:CBJ25874.1 conserved unknown protein [Ectocarpus siliculosus]
MSGPLHTRFRARVLHRFPGYDHEGNGCAFPTNLPLFCLPGGLKLSLEMTLPTFFTFVHTRANGQHMFGYCLCLHEPLGTRHRIELQGLVDAHNKAASRAEGGENDATEPLTTLDPGREVYAPKCLCLLSTWPYFGPFREWLLNLYRISLSPFQIPLERYVGNFLLEVPTPSPGRVEVLYNMGNTTITFACPPPNKPVAWGSVPFEPLFQCLSHENIVILLTCLLLERSIVLKSSQLSLLTPCAEVLSLVLYPLSWSHVYIPVLPEALLGVLAAPMPFLIGVHRSFVEGTDMDVAPYVVQVDLDNDVVEMGGEEAATMPPLPQKRRSKLLAKLAEHAQLGHCRTPAYRQDVMQKSDLAFSMAIRPCDYDDDELDTPPPDWDAVREAFLRFFVTFLSGYRRCLVYPTKANPNPARLFNVDDYLDKLDRDSRPFAEAMCDTQAFQNFIDARIQPETDDLDVVFFDACIAAKRNRSMLHVTKKSDANFLRPDTFVKAKTVFALTPDTTGLDMTAPARSHESRNEGSTFNKYFGGSSKKGDSGGDGNAGSGEEGGGGRRSSTSLAGRRGVFARSGSSRGGGDDDWSPLCAEATVFAVFIVGFCATIGVDPVRPKRGAGFAPKGSVAVVPGAATTTPGPVASKAGGSGGDDSAVRTVLEEEEEEEKEESVRETASGGIGGGGVKVRKSSRMASFSELKHDVREERLYKANAALMVAFEALEAMREKAPAGEEAVYRSLISACGRCGNSEKAMAVVEMMMSTGIVPDAMVSRCLVDAFAMDDSFTDGGAHPLSLLDWSKFQPKHRDGRRSHEPAGGRTEPTFSFKRMMRRFHDKSETTSNATPSRSPSVATVTDAAVAAAPTKTTTTRFTAKATAGSIVMTPESVTPTRHTSSVASQQDFGILGKPAFSSPCVAKEARDSFGGEFETPERRGSGTAGGTGRGRRRSRLHEEDEDVRRSSDLRIRLERSASPYARRGGMSMIDNGSETCPSCQAELTGGQVRAGWSSDPNDYTTECRAVVDVQAAAVAAAGVPGTGWGEGATAGETGDAVAGSGGSGSRPGSGESGGGAAASATLPAGKGASNGGGGGGGASRRKSSSTSTVGSSSSSSKASAAKGALDTCGRRFVSRFSVHSTAEGWEGTTGPGTPLWCEYLPPWVLRKEFHTILSAYGVQYVCSERFRLGLGPLEDGTGPAGGGAGGAQPPSGGGGDAAWREGGGANASRRSVDRTVFWNLVVHFREYCLPITFLLADAASLASGPASVDAGSALFAAE